MPETPRPHLQRQDAEGKTTLPLAVTSFAFLILILSAAAMTFDASARETNQTVEKESPVRSSTRIPHPAIVTNALTGSRIKR
jgi:V8-like Glu-specific endopeptidase